MNFEAVRIDLNKLETGSQIETKKHFFLNGPAKRKHTKSRSGTLLFQRCWMRDYCAAREILKLLLSGPS
jgi:hypothetical protein